MTSYVLEARTPFGGAVQTYVDASNPTLYVAQTAKEYMGHGYDPVTRRIYFSVSVLIGATEGAYGWRYTNPSAHSVYNSSGNDVYNYTTDSNINPIPGGTEFYAQNAMNCWLCYKDIDTDAVTMVNVFDDTATIPNGIVGSDGTYRMCHSGDALIDQQFKLVDPRTGDCWAHAAGDQCNFYVFRASEGYKQRLLPPNEAGHFEMLGSTEDWFLVSKTSNSCTRVGGLIYAYPRLTTADETSNCRLLAYFAANFTDGLGDTWFNTAFWRSCLMASNGKMYLFGSQRTGTRDYRLVEYTPPPSIGSWSGSTQVGGTLAYVTPWAGGTGPNTDCAAYVYNHRVTETPNASPWNRHMMLPLPAQGVAGKIALISILDPQSTSSVGSSHDPSLWRADCTYYDIDAATQDYHQGWVQGLMKADWTPAANLAEAAYAVQFMREINSFLAMHAYDFTSAQGDYADRWFAFSCQPVSGGTFTYDATNASNRTVLAKYRFDGGSAPTLVTAYFDSQWLPDHTAYAARISNDNVVEQSIKMRAELTLDGDQWMGGCENYLWDTGIYDPTTNAFWFGGGNDESIQINTSFSSYRGSTLGDQHPADMFVRLSFVTPSPPTFRSSVWSTIGAAEPAA